jgi:hypothetical protein
VDDKLGEARDLAILGLALWSVDRSEGPLEYLSLCKTTVGSIAIVFQTHSAMPTCKMYCARALIKPTQPLSGLRRRKPH